MRGVYSDEADIPSSVDQDLEGVENLVTFTIAELRNYTSSFSQQLGRGISIVYKGKISQRVDLHRNLNDTKIAVKVFCLDGTNREIWLRELKFLAKLPHHDNIIPLIGKCETNRRLFLIFPFIPRGDLFNFITSPDLKWRQALNIFQGVASALNVLHQQNPPVLFNDLKPKNVLLNANFHPVLCDFGSVCNPGETMIHYTWGYVDSRYAWTGKPDQMSDVFALGLMILQVLMKANVQKDENGVVIQSTVEMVRKLQNRNKPIVHQDFRSSGCSTPEAVERITNLGLNCLNGEIIEVQAILEREQTLEERLTLEQVIAELQAIRATYPPTPEMNFWGCVLPICGSSS